MLVHEQEPGASLLMFVVDRTLPGISDTSLAELQRLLHEAARRMSSTGNAIRYKRCIYMPEEERCICLFEAADLAAVRNVNEIAQVPFRRVSSAIEFWAPGVAEEEAGTRTTGERRSHDDA
jgi:hypothetical protein